jgi:transposase
MKQVDTIKQMERNGMNKSEIAERLKIDRKTINKYLRQEDFTLPLQEVKYHPSKLDHWKPVIDKWLEEDRRMRYKQRHTARRIHDRLTQEYGNQYDCSYPLVQRYCKLKRAERHRERGGYLELTWYPGEAQMDFGEIDGCDGNELHPYKFLILSFPYSNGAYVQLFGGETAECVTQGLLDIFHRIGGVPRRIVVDNASGVGRRIGERVQYSDLFLRFKCHYGFEVTFCNPYSGHEKGHVENKVGYTRRNFFVPAPVFNDIEEQNYFLLGRSEQDWQRNHYKKHRLIADLFQEDKKALSPLPEKPFAAVRFEKIATDGYGKFCLERQHWYSSKPEMGNGHIIARIGAHHVEVLDLTGELITRHRRLYGNRRTDITDWSTSAARVLKHPGSWRNSGIRAEVGDMMRNAMDAMDKSGLKEALSIIRDLSPRYGFESVITAMEEAVSSAALTRYNTQAIILRLVGEGLNGIPQGGPDLCSYDDAFLGTGGVQ